MTKVEKIRVLAKAADQLWNIILDEERKTGTMPHSIRVAWVEIRSAINDYRANRKPR